MFQEVTGTLQRVALFMYLLDLCNSKFAPYLKLGKLGGEDFSDLERVLGGAWAALCCLRCIV